MPISLSGTSVLVAGATGGLGAPIARLLAQEGADLTLVARSPERLAQVAPSGAATLATDLRQPVGPQQAVEHAVARFGRLDGIVFAAGVVAFGPAAQVEDDVLAELFEINVFAPVRLLRAAAPHLAASAQAGGPGFAVNISAVVAEQPMAGMAPYTAAKAALAAFDAAAGRELRRQRVRLVDARPPHTETGLASRPVAGSAPALAAGLKPEAVAARIVRAIVEGERDLPSSSFTA